MENIASFETELAEGILTVTLSSPETKNALSMACIDTLREIIQEVYDNSEIKSVIITGAGEEVFATGTVPQEIKALNELNSRKFAEHSQETFALIEHCHKPVLAAVNGAAISGGFALALACHLCIASENATFSFPEVAMGIIPGFGGTQRLTHLIGKKKALELMMTGESITAAEAQALGVVSYVASYKEALMKRSREILQKIMAHAPLAVGMLVNCTNAAYNPDEDGYQTEANSFAHCCKTEDLKEGISALLEKRLPVFRGV
ncbi:MAG: enoyl-CoA hydratase-related protein [Amoebophilaceae bacterium]|jgi:enoyl-CoA hydratase|nr:enoyl-CoA hydratase-related protein [Amoebophilaceae bacterium]